MVAFSWYEGGSDLGRAEVQAAARRHDVYLPKRWAWYESPLRPRGVEITKRLCGGRAIVAWHAATARGMLAKFYAHDDWATPLVDAFSVKNRVVSVYGETSFRTPFDLRRDRAVLAAILNRGLSRAPAALKARLNTMYGMISRRDLLRLYELGVPK
jgi:hypothetical protein